MRIDFQKLIAQAINPEPKEPLSPSLADVLVSDIVQSLEEALAEHPQIPVPWLNNPSVFANEVLKNLGLNVHVGKLEAQITTAIRKTIRQQYRNRQTSSRAIVGLRIWEPNSQLLDQIKQECTFDDLRFLGELGGGRSGSRVFGCYANTSNSDSIVVVKLTEDESTFESEKSGHGAALGSWMRDWVPKQPKGFQVSLPLRAQFVLVSPLALPPTATQIYPESLQTVVAKGQVRAARRVISSLSDGYATHLDKSANRVTFSRTGFVNSMLAHWPGLQRVGWAEDLFWEQAELPGPSQRWLQDGNTILCNPLWYLHSAVASDEQARYVFLKSLQHGDLNCSNVLVSLNDSAGDSHPTIRFIDFEKAVEQSALLDICWLALWLLAASHHPSEPDIDIWTALPSQVVATVLNKQATDKHLGHFQLGVDLVTELVSRIWQIPSVSRDENQRGLMQNVLTEQFAVTLAVTSTAMAAYEVRKFSRAVNDGADDSDDACRVALLWACSYLRIAAFALQEHVGSTPGRATSNLTDFLTEVFIRSPSKED